MVEMRRIKAIVGKGFRIASADWPLEQIGDIICDSGMSDQRVEAAFLLIRGADLDELVDTLGIKRPYARWLFGSVGRELREEVLPPHFKRLGVEEVSANDVDDEIDMEGLAHILGLTQRGVRSVASRAWAELGFTPPVQDGRRIVLSTEDARLVINWYLEQYAGGEGDAERD